MRPRQLHRSTVGVLMLTGLFLVVIASIGVVLVRERHALALDDGAEQASRFVTGAVAVINRSLLGVDVLLANLDSMLALSEQQQEWIQPEVAGAAMQNATRQNLLVSTLALVDSTGQTLASSDASGQSMALSLPPAFITEALAQQVSTLVISAPSVSFNSAETVLYLGRQVRLADGSKLIAVAEVAVSKLTGLIVQGADIRGLEATLERSNGDILAAVPLGVGAIKPSAAKPSTGSPSDAGPWRNVPARLSGTPAIVALRATLYDGTRITASIPLETVLANWYKDRLLIVAMCFVLGLMIASAGAFALWYLRTQRQLQAGVSLAKQTLDQALESMITGFVLLDTDQQVITWNRRFLDLFPWLVSTMHAGLPFRRLAELSALSDLPDASDEERALRVQARMDHLQSGNETRQITTAEGLTLEIIERRTPDGGYVIVYHDVSGLHQARVEVEHMAYFDQLTQLPNRRLLADRLRQALLASERNGQLGAVLFLDLDHFKTLNDTAGHLMGDRLLQQVAQRLSGCVRAQDTVARLGGDEFVVMLQGLGEEPLEAAQATRKVGEAILEALTQPFSLDQHVHTCSSSIGATLFGLDARHTPEDLLKQADIAMYQVKGAGRNALCFFDPEMLAAVTARAEMERDLRQALSLNQFMLHYQAQVDGDGVVQGAEVLIRWHHPDRGMVPPGQFIAVAEDTGLILQIGQWVLEAACRQLAAWSENPRTAALTVSVNVSARQFRSSEFVNDVRRTLEQTRVPVQRLKLELTESLVLDNVRDTINKMQEIKALGVRFSMDDFGTGYSSLAYLSRLPLDQLKIDQSFVRNMQNQPADAAVVTTIIGLAQSLGLEVIAEGVETQDQREMLAAHGCHHCQGYLFGKPAPVQEFEATLNIA